MGEVFNGIMAGVGVDGISGGVDPGIEISALVIDERDCVEWLESITEFGP